MRARPMRNREAWSQAERARCQVKRAFSVRFCIRFDSLLERETLSKGGGGEGSPPYHLMIVPWSKRMPQPDNQIR